MSDKATKKNQKQKSATTTVRATAKAPVTLKKGALCEAKDYANTWYKSRVLEVDEPNKKVLVHFLGWNARYDQWFEIGSPDLKLFEKGHKKTSNVAPQKAATEAKPTAAATPLKKFEVGSRVLAKWKLDNLYYPGDVLRFITKGRCTMSRMNAQSFLRVCLS